MRLISTMLMSVSLVALNSAYAQSVQAPVPAAGNSWSYKTSDMWSAKLISESTLKTVGVSGEYVRIFYETKSASKNGEFVMPQTSESTTRADLNSVIMYKGERQENPWYKWPLEAGKKWSFQIKQELPPTGSATIPQVMTQNIDAEVKGWETLELPAGKLKAIKIVYKSTWTAVNPASNGTSVSTTWYSPDVKRFVQYTSENFGPDGSPQARTLQQLVHYEVK
ncbi:MAG: hypothetical protein V4488_07480 [Pseudomonadota bacterium]